MRQLLLNSHVLRLAWLGLLILLFCEVVFYPGVILHHTGFRPIVFVFMYAWWKIVAGYFFHLAADKKLFGVLFLYIGPMLALLTIVIGFIERLTYTNYVYTYLFVNAKELVVFYLYFIFLLALGFDRLYFKENIRKVIFVAPLYFYPILLLYFYNPSLDAWLKGENRLVELLQFGLFGLSSYLSWKLFKLSQNKKKWWEQIVPTIFLCISIGFFFIAGEEISWGQKLFEIEVPENIAQYNTQKEFNIHNNKNVIGSVYYAYGIISFLAAFLWIIPKKFNAIENYLIKSKLLQFIPPWYLMFYFVLNFLYVVIRLNNNHPAIYNLLNIKLLGNVGSIWEWEEYTELCFAVGLFIFILALYRKYSK